MASGRKRRLDLPRGRFNKEDHRDLDSPGPASEEQLQSETVPPASKTSTQQQKGETDEVSVNGCKNNENGLNGETEIPFTPIKSLSFQWFLRMSASRLQNWWRN